MIDYLRVGIYCRQIASCDLIADRKDIALCMEMLTHTNFAKVKNRHYSDIQREQWSALLIAGDHGNAVAF